MTRPKEQISFEKPFEVHTDASNRATSGVLVQDGHPLAFESKKLKDAEQRYFVHEKKMVVVVHCLEALRHYLLGTKFTVMSNKVANTYFKTQKKLTPKQDGKSTWLNLISFGCINQGSKTRLQMH